MTISEHLDENAIVELEGTDSKAVLSELIGAAHRVYQFKAPLDRVIEVVMARERIGSTGLGGGIAIPHAQFGDIEREIVVVGRSKEGIDFGAADGERVQIFFLLLGPQNVKGHLAVLAAIARICKSEGFMEKAIAAEDAIVMRELVLGIDV